MAAITVTTKRSRTMHGRGAVITSYGTGTANQADTLTSTAVGKNKTQRLGHVSCTYSATPTQAGVTVTIDSGLGAAYDALLTTGSANVLTTVYIPANDVYLVDGDAIVVAAPAGGVGITAAIQIVVEED